MKVKLFNSGETRSYPCLFALVSTPDTNLLFDTGYSYHFLEATRKFPYSLFRIATPVNLEGGSALEKLAKEGITQKDLDFVFISHFHADHISECRDFPQSQFIFSREGYESVKDKKGFSALRRAFLPNLLPLDIERRVNPIEQYKKVDISEQLNPFAEGYDISGDRKLIAVDLSGHAVGQYGLLIDDKVFLVSDACWRTDGLGLNFTQSLVVATITANREAYELNSSKIMALRKNRNDLIIIPSHCSKSWRQYGKTENLL